jgi:hypothetical protein
VHLRQEGRGSWAPFIRPPPLRRALFLELHDDVHRGADAHGDIDGLRLVAGARDGNRVRAGIRDDSAWVRGEVLACRGAMGIAGGLERVETGELDQLRGARLAILFEDAAADATTRVSSRLSLHVVFFFVDDDRPSHDRVRPGGHGEHF